MTTLLRDHDDDEPRGKFIVYGRKCDMISDLTTYTRYDHAICRSDSSCTFTIDPQTKRFSPEHAASPPRWGAVGIDATDLPDRFNAIRVFRDALQYGDCVEIKFLGTNAAVRDLVGDRVDLRGAFSLFYTFSVYFDHGKPFISTCSFVRTRYYEPEAALRLDHDYDATVRNGEATADDDPEASDHVPGTLYWTPERLVSKYKRFHSPWASLVVLVSLDRLSTEWDSDCLHTFIGRGKKACKIVDDWCISKLVRIAESVRDNADCTRSIVQWSLGVFVGPERTRKDVAAILRARALKPLKLRKGLAFFLVEYMAPIELELDVESLAVQIPGEHGPHMLERLFHLAGTPLPASIRGVPPILQASGYVGVTPANPITFAERQALVPVFQSPIAKNNWPLPHLSRIFNAHMRWSFQWRHCFLLALTLAGCTPDLSPYPIMWILDWTDEEFCWCSTLYQHITLIEGVVKSVQKLRAARGLRAVASRPTPPPPVASRPTPPPPSKQPVHGSLIRMRPVVNCRVISVPVVSSSGAVTPLTWKSSRGDDDANEIEDVVTAWLNDGNGFTK